MRMTSDRFYPDRTDAISSVVVVTLSRQVVMLLRRRVDGVLNPKINHLLFTITYLPVLSRKPGRVRTAGKAGI